MRHLCHSNTYITISFQCVCTNVECDPSLNCLACAGDTTTCSSCSLGEGVDSSGACVCKYLFRALRSGWQGAVAGRCGRALWQGAVAGRCGRALWQGAVAERGCELLLFFIITVEFRHS